MIVYLKGNILNTPTVTIVNTVNTVGVMGKGIALSLKNRYSDMFEKYQEACKSKELTVGKLMYYPSVDHDVLLFPTKAHWKYPSRMKWIEDGLKKFCEQYIEFNITSISFPMLGCGNGGLDWNDVKPLMEQYLSELPIQVLVYTGTGPSIIGSEKPVSDYQKWLQSVSLNFDVDALLQRFSDYYMMPYDFKHLGESYQMLYMPGEIKITSASQVLAIPEDDFKEQWAKWKTNGLIKDSDSDKAPLFYMLESMGYLEPVIFESVDNQTPGYQMLLMYDRAAKSLKGTK